MARESMLVRALGPLEVGRPPEHASLGGPRQRGVLALLVARAGLVASMDELIDGVWGDDPPASARKTVQGYLAVLRREIAPLGVTIDSTAGGGYMLAIDRSSVDIARFEDLVSSAAPLRSTEPAKARAQLAEAIALWRGRAFGDLADLPGIEPYAVRLEERRRSAYEQLLELDVGAGDLDRAAAELEGLTREEPWREQPWLLLMTAQFRQGRQAEALRSYGRMRALWAEAGLDPTPALRETAQRILTDEEPRPDPRPVDASAPTVAADAAAPELPAPWPLPTALRRLTESPDLFVGRRAELTQAEAALAAAAAANVRQIVFVSGEPGAGKTRLCAELARVAVELDVVVLFGGAEEGLGMPFQPLLEALEQLGDVVGAEAVRAWAAPHDAALGLLSPPFGSASTTTDVDAQKAALFAATTDIVRRLTALRPVLWVLDDLQWTSRAMCQLIAHLCRVLVDVPLTIVITFRDTDVAPDHPMAALLADARRAPGMHELRLAGLDDTDVLELVGAALIETVRARAGGNPFFVTELARHLREGIGGPDLPAVDDVVLRRVHRLPTSTVGALRMAAAYGQRFPVRVIAHALARPLLDVADCLDQAVVARLAEPVPGGELAYGFPHALVRDAIYGSLGVAERLRSHLAIATALRDVYPDSRPVVTELANHWYLAAPAGYVDEAVDACRQAARAARAGLGLDEAIAHLERALDVVTADPTQPARQRAELLVELARANGDAGRATALLDRAVEASQAASAAGLDDVVVASALVMRAGMTLTALAADRRTASLLKAGLERTAPDSAEHLMLRAKHMTTKFFVFDVATLATIADELLDGALATGRRDAIRAVAEDVAWFARRAQHHRCVELLRDTIDVADPLSEVPYLAQALDELYGSGDGPAFRQMFATFAQRARGDVTYSVAAAFGRATLTLFDGHIERAVHEARGARRHGMAERRVAVVGAYTAFALHGAWLQGRLASVQRVADWAFADLPHPQSEAWRAWAHAARGDGEPLRTFTTSFTNLHRLMLVSARFTGGSLGALTHAAVLTRQPAALSLATELWTDVHEAFHGGFFPPDLAVAHYRGMLAHARGLLDEAERHYRDAIVDHEAIGSRPHRAVSERALATVLTDHGRVSDHDEIHALRRGSGSGCAPRPSR